MPEEKKSRLNAFAFQQDSKVPAADLRVLQRFAVNQQYDNLHLATQALRSIEQGVRWLGALEKVTGKLRASGLVRDQTAVDDDLARQQDMLAALHPVLEQLREDRADRLREVDEMEQQLQEESRRQLNQQLNQQRKRKEAVRLALAKQAAEVQLAEREEPVVPGMNLDPKLLAQSVKALNLKEKHTEKAKKQIPGEQ